MSANEAFLAMQTFFENRQAPAQAMKSLRAGTEVGVIIGESVECAVFYKENRVLVEQRPALNPGLIFHVKPEAVELLSRQTRDDLGDICVNLLKEMLTGAVSVRIPGRILPLLRDGYFDIFKKAGTPVATFLARNGIAGFPQFLKKLKDLRSSPDSSPAPSRDQVTHQNAQRAAVEK